MEGLLQPGSAQMGLSLGLRQDVGLSLRNREPPPNVPGRCMPPPHPKTPHTGARTERKDGVRSWRSSASRRQRLGRAPATPRAGAST